VDSWAEQYQFDDTPLDALLGLPELTRTQVEAVIGWKLNRTQNRRKAALRNLARQTDEEIRDLTGRAFRCNDDLGAVLILCEMKGVGVPISSAILMARNPRKYTVADNRAWNSLTAHGLLKDYESTSWRRAWIPYLTTCRAEAKRLECSLRKLDRAFWAAKGRTELPSR
jgi:hypothetical protein